MDGGILFLPDKVGSRLSEMLAAFGDSRNKLYELLCHTSSIRTTAGDSSVLVSRVAVWTEADVQQENITWDTVDYDEGYLPLVAVDEAVNLSYFGGCLINERWEHKSAALDHFVFVTNLIDYLHDSTDPSGPVLFDCGTTPAVHSV